MFSANDVDDFGPLGRVRAPQPRPARTHRVNLCCAASVESMVSEVARCLVGLGFETTVSCGAAARRSLMGDGPVGPAIHVVCVQGPLRDQAVGPLRRALADRDRPNQHLFVAVLDLSVPLALVGQIRRFAEALDDPGPDPAHGRQGAERRQWREHVGARNVTETPPRNYRPLQVIDRSEERDQTAPPPRQVPRFSATASMARVRPTGKYNAIAAGHVAEPPSLRIGLDALLCATPPPSDAPGSATAPVTGDTDHDPAVLRPEMRAAVPLDSPTAVTRSLGPVASSTQPRDLLAAASEPDAVVTDAPTEGEVEQPAANDEGTATEQRKPRRRPSVSMAKLALRRMPTGAYPAIVEKPTRSTAFGDRGVGHQGSPNAGDSTPAASANAEPSPQAEPSAVATASAGNELEAVSHAEVPQAPGQPADRDPDQPEVAPARTHDDEAHAKAPAERSAGDLSAAIVRRRVIPGEVLPRRGTRTSTSTNAATTATIEPTPAAGGRRSPMLWVGVAAAVAALLWWGLGTAPPAPRPTAMARPAGVTPPPNRVAPAAEPMPVTRAPAPGQAPRAPAPRGAVRDAPLERVAVKDARIAAPDPAAVSETTEAPPIADAAPRARDSAETAPVGRPSPPPPSMPPAVDPAAPIPDPIRARLRQRLAAAVTQREAQSVGNFFVASPPNIGTTSWAVAVAQCRRLSVNGVGGWALPWRKQLKQIVTVRGTRHGLWWSRSAVDGDDDMVIAMDAATRNLGEYMKSEVTGAVVCVRTAR